MVDRGVGLCYNSGMKHIKQHIHYDRWCGINARCYYTGKKQYKDYGGRGITNYWRRDSIGFCKYLDEVLGECPAGYTLDRIDNDGNYEPGNLRWASYHTQLTNQRRRIGKTGYQWVNYRMGSNSDSVIGRFNWNKKPYIICGSVGTDPVDVYLQVLSLRSLVCQA